jgi:phospholipase D-like protein
VPRVVLVLAVLAATIFCIIDCIQSDEREVRNLPKVVWVLLILIAPVVGPAAWFFAGRPRTDPVLPGPQRPAAPRRPSAPDDDPTFLAGLDRTNEERRRLQAWERELEAREREITSPPGAGTPAGEDGARDRREPDAPREQEGQAEQEGPGDEPANRS